MKYIDPYSNELNIDTEEKINKILQTDLQLWKEGSGDSIFIQNESYDGLLFIKFNQGYFLLSMIDYKSPSWSNPESYHVYHTIGGNETSIQSNFILDESQAFGILKTYLKSGNIPTDDTWVDFEF